MNYLEMCFDKDPNIVSKNIENEIILIPIKQSMGNLESVYTLSEVGAFIWELIDGKSQIKEIKRAVIDEFDVEEEKAEQDLIEFIKQLYELGGILSVK